MTTEQRARMLNILSRIDQFEALAVTCIYLLSLNISRWRKNE